MPCAERPGAPILGKTCQDSTSRRSKTELKASQKASYKIQSARHNCRISSPVAERLRGTTGRGTVSPSSGRLASHYFAAVSISRPQGYEHYRTSSVKAFRS